MFTFATLARAGSLAAVVTIFGAMAVPTVARADGTSTAAAALFGAVVGTLIFDSSRHQYYYVNGGNRRYVSNSTAQGWYQHQDPQYYNSHQSDFRNNPGKFDSEYRGSHHRRPNQ